MRLAFIWLALVMCLGATPAGRTPGAAAPAGGSSPVVRFAVLADQTGGAMPGVYDSVLIEVARLDPDFVVTVGDQVEGYAGPDTASLRGQFDGVFAQYDRAFGPRWRKGDFLILTPGNHDITDDRAEPLWRELVGPPSRRVDVCGVTLLVLDTSRSPEPSEGALPAEQVHFLERELAAVPPEQPVVVLTHKPFFSSGVWRGREDPLHRLFVERGVDAALAGHWHDYIYEPRDGVIYAVCGSSGGGTGGQGLANGEFVGFLWGTIRDGRVALTPVSVGNVHAPDIFNAGENWALNGFQTRGLVLSPFDLAKPASTVRVLARNTGDRTNADSLRWTVPADWRVSPRSVPFAAPAGDSTAARFDLSYAGSPFPLPTLSATLSFGRGKSFTATAPLRIERTAQCPAARSLKVDGVINPQEWASSRAETLFMSREGGRSTTDPTEFLFARDGRGLYLAARCAVAPGHPLVSQVAQRDGAVYQEDCVGWLLAPSDSVVFQIYVNPQGTVLDGRGPVVEGYAQMDYRWNGDYRVATSTDADHWSIELFVPFKTLGIRGGQAPRELRLNMRRKQPAVGSSADWMPIAFDPRAMGHLAFVK